MKTVTLKTIGALTATSHDLIKRAPEQHDIVRLINRYIEEEKRPLYVYCHTTGKKCGMTAKEYFAKKLKEYGNDIVRLMTEYRGKRGTVSAASIGVGIRKNRKGNDFKLAPSHNPFKDIGEWTHESDKAGNPTITRKQKVMLDGTVVLEDFNWATETTTTVAAKKSKNKAKK